ncbi:hypothetical protein BJV78DRAFT_1120552 [Lactifluus subvellereus]|nr:hypothetical protein BJV78DRAFT_1120552 [Lactifluus subvellereus]
MSIKRYFSQVPSDPDQRPQKKLKESKVPGVLYSLNSKCLSTYDPPPDLPLLNNELLTLLDLSSPSLSTHASIEEHFDRIAEILFQRSYLVCCSTKSDGSPRRVLYEFLEFEFYLIKVDCHLDPYTHDGEEQRLSGAWYFHRVPRHGPGSSGSGPPGYRSGSRKGLDLTIGTLSSSDSPIIPTSPSHAPSAPSPIPIRGGILLRSVRRLSDSTVISGPSLLVDELLRTSGASEIPELVNEKWLGDISASRVPSVENPESNSPATLFIGVKETTGTPPQMYRSPRVGLDLSHPSTRLNSSDKRVRYVSKPYRYFILPRLLTVNGRGQTFLGVHDHCVKVLEISKKSLLVGKIASLTSLQAQTIEKYLNAYREGLETGELEHFIGFRGKGVSASPTSFLQLLGALRCRELAE